METPLAKMKRLVDALAHEINVSQGIECNEQTKYHIHNHFIKDRNENELKWNELNFWLRANPTAKVHEIQLVRAELNKGESVRGLNVR